jgi:uroporphyrinogen decarboxylase
MSKKILIELFTLDSAGCAPCTYMKEMVDNSRDKIDAEIEVVEHKIKDKAALKLMQQRGVTSIPTICINGDIMYESIIPTEDELFEEINKRLGCDCGGTK